MRINRNIIANYGSRLWSGVSAFIFVPLYLRFLGSEAFGLLTFSTMLLGIAFILDVGMSSAFAREMARESDRARLADLLRSLELVYVLIVLVVAVLAILGSGFIANYWLNASTLNPERVRWSVALMLISSILQVMMALYLGGLLGSNRHGAAAGYQVGFGIVRSGLVLVPLYFGATVEFVFGWQVGASLLFLLLMRMSVWSMLRDGARRPRFSADALRNIGKFTAGMFGIALISTVNTQCDKLVVSKVFSLEVFGAYSIASMIGQIPSMLALPLAITVLPRLTAHVARSENSELRMLYLRYSMMIATVAFGAAAGAIAATPQLLTLILGTLPTPTLVETSRILAVGGALLAVQYMPYHLAIACGHTRTNIVFGAVSAAVLPLAIWIGACQLGLIGAAWPWVILNAAGAILLAWRITPRFLGPNLGEWAIKANLLPLAVIATFMIPGTLLIALIDSIVVAIGTIAILGLLALGVNALFLRRVFNDSQIKSGSAPRGLAQWK